MGDWRRIYTDNEQKLTVGIWKETDSVIFDIEGITLNPFQDVEFELKIEVIEKILEQAKIYSAMKADTD